MLGIIGAVLQILMLLLKDRLDEKVSRRKREEEEVKRKAEIYDQFKMALKNRDADSIDSVLRRLRDEKA